MPITNRVIDMFSVIYVVISECMKIPLVLRGLNATLRTASAHFERNPISTSKLRQFMSRVGPSHADSLFHVRDNH